MSDPLFNILIASGLFLAGFILPGLGCLIFLLLKLSRPHFFVTLFFITNGIEFCLTQYLWFAVRERAGFEIFIGLPVSGFFAGGVQALVCSFVPRGKMAAALMCSPLISLTAICILESRLEFATLSW